MKKSLQLFLSLIALLTFSSCATTPKVKYISEIKPEQRGYPSFYLSQSIINITKPLEDSEITANTSAADRLGFSNKKSLTGPADFENAKITITRTQDKSQLYYIIPHETEYYKPNFSVTYIDNTKLINSIGTAAKDSRKEALVSIGTVAVKLAPLFMASPSTIKKATTPDKKGLNVPCAIKIKNEYLTEAYQGRPEDQKWNTVKNSPGWEYKIDVISPDIKKEQSQLINRTQYFEDAAKSEVKTLPYSSCLNIKFTLKNEYEDEISFNTTIANPNLLDVANFPQKGTIKLHTICGADIATENNDSPSRLDLLSELFNQADLIYQAMNEEEKADSN